jgi:hypothetical protein
MPDDDLIELIAPGGTDEVNHGTTRYRVDNSGRVRVPREAAFHLIRKAGFRVAEPDPEIVPIITTAPSADGDGAAPAADPRRTKPALKS